MDSVQKIVPQTQVAEAKRAKKSSGPKRPRKLVKGSAATKRWMAHLRSLRKGAGKKAKTPARRSRKTPARRGRKPGPKKGSKKAKTPARRGRKPGPKKGSKKASRKGRKASPRK